MALTYYYDLASVSTFTNNDAQDTKTKLNSNFALLNTNVIGIDNRFEFALDALFGNVILDGLAITYGGTGLSFTAGAGSALIGTRIQVAVNTTVTVLANQAGAKIYIGNNGAFYTAAPTGIDYMEYATYSSNTTDITAINVTAKNITLGSYVGKGVAGVDYTLTFDGESNDGVITWMEDEDYFKFSDDIMLPDNERIYIGTAADAGIYYDGTNANIDSDLVAPSDLIIDCGTDKTLVLEETVWKDIQVPAHSVKTGASAPGFDGTAAGDATLLTYAFDGASVEQVYFTIQMPHDWKEGTTIFPHVHFSPTADSGAVEKGVSWKLEYTWASNAATFGASAELEMNKNFTDAQWDHLIATNDTGISGAGKTISSILVCRLYRDPDDAQDTFESDVLFLGFDIHYEAEKLGSRQEYTS